QVFRAGLDPCTHLYLSAALAIVVLREIGDASRGKVRDDAEPFSLEMIDRGAAEIVEIVRENLGGKSHGDAFGALEEHQGKLGRKRDRFLCPPIVTLLPDRGLRIKDHVPRKRCQTRLDITRRGGIVAGK